MRSERFENGEFVSLVQDMTPAELGDILSGHGMWKTEANERLGIPNMVMTDGTYGVRYSIQQIDQDEKGGQDLPVSLTSLTSGPKMLKWRGARMKPATVPEWLKLCL
uniref:CAZy families GH3 protein n=1 Tax=uncultured Pantoea sp. TaxID=218084 RepID=A0A060CEW7_9GAMM|nr:CAZy families GH3 protein [uncultured Pantoea sp.]